ncbi:MAG: isoprenylcysteine carboxylmethyltransferase family protein [candidate division WOR-3 bacterium]|jgi:protein-S-isoprenylcysteine O-methyltransferase Ste14
MIRVIPISLLTISIIFTYIFKNFLTLKIPKFFGLLIIFPSLLLIFLGLFTLLLNKTTIIPGEKPKKLVNFGIFGICRNPIYLGDLLLIVGFSIYFQTLIGIIFAILFFLVMDKFVIPKEEEILEKTFGESYVEYKKCVKRWGIF